MPSGWGDAFASNLAMGYTNADPKGGGAFYAGSKAGTRGDRNVENFNHVNFAGSTTPYYGNDDHPYYRIGNTLYKFLPGESFDDVSGEQKLGSESRFLHKDDEVSNGISKDLEFYWIPPQGNVCGEIYEPSLGECPAGTSYDSNVNRCTKQSCKLDPSSTSDDYICVQDDGTAGDATQRFCGNTTVQCGNSCVDINGTPTCNPGTVCTASNICAKPTCVDGDCIGTGTNANFCGEPPIPPNHYIMTTGGDVYIGDNISSDLRDAFSRAENISIGTNPFNNNPRLNTISDSLQNKRPYISSNLLFTNSTNAWTLDKSLGSVIKATLPLNTNTIPFIDRSSTEYTGSSSSSNPRLDNSFYHYYLPKFASSLETVVNNSLSISPGDVTLRQLFAPSENPAENDIKKIISITDTSAVLDRLTLSGNTTLVCNSKTIFLIKGNLAITTDIINQDPDDSCIFIIEGHLTIALAQRASISSNTSYRILEGMFMADSVSTVGGNSERGLILNGSILTNESSASNPDSAYQNYPGNNHNIKTDDYWQRPQELYIYDPRHLSIWSEQLSGSGSFSAIRETRFLNITD
jgi:hypothetical protein